MPIIELHDPEHPLDQGDLLKGVNLFHTANADTVEGGEYALSKQPYCLVLSRPCVTANKSKIIVAGVEKYQNPTPPEIDSFVKAKRFLDRIRDGDGSPDLFYLGQMLGDNDAGRFSARLDNLHTISLPAKPDTRNAFVKKHRFARLCSDFCRDLHTRLFQAFSVMGFDDLGWYSLADLRYVIQTGKAEIGKIEAAIALLEAVQDAEGSKARQITTERGKIVEINKQMAGHEAELSRRLPPSQS